MLLQLVTLTLCGIIAFCNAGVVPEKSSDEVLVAIQLEHYSNVGGKLLNGRSCQPAAPRCQPKFVGYVNAYESAALTTLVKFEIPSRGSVDAVDFLNAPAPASSGSFIVRVRDGQSIVVYVRVQNTVPWYGQEVEGGDVGFFYPLIGDFEFKYQPGCAAKADVAESGSASLTVSFTTIPLE